MGLADRQAHFYRDLTGLVFVAQCRHEQATRLLLGLFGWLLTRWVEWIEIGWNAVPINVQATFDVVGDAVAILIQIIW